VPGWSKNAGGDRTGAATRQFGVSGDVAAERRVGASVDGGGTGAKAAWADGERGGVITVGTSDHSAFDYDFDFDFGWWFQRACDENSRVASDSSGQHSSS